MKEVTEYISSKKDFSLTCQITDLDLQDDGKITCTEPYLHSIYKKYESNTSTMNPLVHSNFPLLGPDSIGTLSFTSGSTGIPKGVRGRHFSLTNFYPWLDFYKI